MSNCKAGSKGVQKSTYESRVPKGKVKPLEYGSANWARENSQKRKWTSRAYFGTLQPWGHTYNHTTDIAHISKQDSRDVLDIGVYLTWHHTDVNTFVLVNSSGMSKLEKWVKGVLVAHTCASFLHQQNQFDIFFYSRESVGSQFQSSSMSYRSIQNS